MSLDVYLESPGELGSCTCHWCGDTHKTTSRELLFHANITHNLGKMAEAADVYYALWRPEEIGIKKASDLIEVLQHGYSKLTDDPDTYKAMNPINGWGSYESLVVFVADYLNACRLYPDAFVRVSR